MNLREPEDGLIGGGRREGKGKTLSSHLERNKGSSATETDEFNSQEHSGTRELREVVL